MSEKKENFDKNQYRKNKKINKANIRNGQNKKFFSNNEDSILNSLPSGAFERKEIKSIREELELSSEDDNNSKIILNKEEKIEVTDEEEDLFDESYFEPVVYIKK